MKKYHCNIHNEDHMEVITAHDGLIYFEIVFEGEYGVTDHSVGLTKEQVGELIDDLNKQREELK